MATYGLNDNGVFIRPALLELIEARKQRYRNIFGANINTATDSNFDKIASIAGKAEYDMWEMMGGVFDSQTYQGAEGKYLDDLFARRGIYRRGKTKATGSCQLEIGPSVPYNTVYPTTLYTINNSFVLQEDVLVAGNIVAQRILNSQLILGNYTFTIVNTNTSVLQSLNLTLSDKTPNSNNLNTFFNNIKTFIVDNTVNTNTNNIFIDYVNGNMYIGFTDANTMVGLAQRVDFKTLPIIGNRFVTMNVTAKETGFNPVGVSGITSISPQPSGFVSITNIESFFSGSNVESDGEYRARATSVISSPAAATRSAIINGLLTGVEGVTKVKIFNNPTPNTSPVGIPPYKFVTVVYGGETPAISNKLYDLIACSNNTWGTTSYVVNTEDGNTETIYHSKATEKRVSIKVSYKTSQNRPLADSEKTSVISGLVSNIASYQINPTIYNIQLSGAVQKSLPLLSFNELIVQIKLESDPDSSYSTNTFTTQTEDVVILTEDQVFFNQIV